MTWSKWCRKVTGKIGFSIFWWAVRGEQWGRPRPRSLTLGGHFPVRKERKYVVFAVLSLKREKLLSVVMN